MTVLADTGAVYALLDRSDAWHRRVVSYWEGHAAEIRLPEPILAELEDRVMQNADSLGIGDAVHQRL